MTTAGMTSPVRVSRWLSGRVSWELWLRSKEIDPACPSTCPQSAPRNRTSRAPDLTPVEADGPKQRQLAATRRHRGDEHVGEHGRRHQGHQDAEEQRDLVDVAHVERWDRIRDGQLLRQRARVWRGKPEISCELKHHSGGVSPTRRARD